jgi:hypothetical protein
MRLVYTGEDLKWDTPVFRRPKGGSSGRISNRYRYLTFEELKWDILILQRFKNTTILH